MINLLNGFDATTLHEPFIHAQKNWAYLNEKEKLIKILQPVSERTPEVEQIITYFVLNLILNDDENGVIHYATILDGENFDPEMSSHNLDSLRLRLWFEISLLNKDYRLHSLLLDIFDQIKSADSLDKEQFMAATKLWMEFRAKIKSFLELNNKKVNFIPTETTYEDTAAKVKGTDWVAFMEAI